MSEEAKVEEGRRTICDKREGYQKTRSASGKPSLNSGDAVAKCLDGLNLDQNYTAAADMTGVKVGELREKYEHLNPGMQRMVLGNRIRGAVNADEKAKEPKGLLARLQGKTAPIQAKAADAAQKKADADAKAKAEADKKAA